MELLWSKAVLFLSIFKFVGHLEFILQERVDQWRITDHMILQIGISAKG